LLSQLNESLATQGIDLILSDLMTETTRALQGAEKSGLKNAIYFADTDSALEWCEDQLIQAVGASAQAHGPITLREMDILSGMSDRDTALLESIVEETRFQAGDVILREGDPAEALFLLAEGLVTVCLRMENGAGKKRISTITPGLAFGELALLDGGTRSADVIADTAVKCYILPVAKLEILAERHPEVYARLMLNIARELSARLRRADSEIRSLSE
jgi:glutaminase